MLTRGDVELWVLLGELPDCLLCENLRREVHEIRVSSFGDDLFAGGLAPVCGQDEG